MIKEDIDSILATGKRVIRAKAARVLLGSMFLPACFPCLAWSCCSAAIFW
jgi:hypothetical protein